MRRFGVGILILLVFAATRGATARDPFAVAAVAPADTRLFIHVEDAASIRKELADRPLATWLNSLGGSGQCQAAWGNLCKAAECDQGSLFDDLLGRSFTLIARSGSEWSLITEVDPALSVKLLGHLRVRLREPKDGVALVEWPEQDMLIARDKGILVVGPAKQPGLFYALLPRLDQANADSLAAQPLMAQAKDLGSGRIGVFVRHEFPMGGYSLALADVNHDQLIIRHRAHFENAPFQHGITKLACDFSFVKEFDGKALLAFGQPCDVDDGPFESFVSASIGESLLSPEMRKNQSGLRLLVVGEQDLRQQDKPIDLLGTTFVSCVEVKDSGPALAQLDHQMIKLAKHIDNLGKGSFLVRIPSTRILPPDQPRQVDLSSATDWFSGGFPIMKDVSLNWTVAESPGACWFVIGTERHSLNDVVRVLKKGCKKHPEYTGQFDSCGVGNGTRVAKHLRSWSDHADLFATPEDTEAVRSSLKMISDLASGIQKCTWKLARPTANDMKLDIEIQLAPPEPSRSGPQN